MNRRQIAILLVALSLSSVLVFATINANTTAKASPSADIQGMEISGDEATVNDSPSTFTLDASGTVAWENIPGILNGVEIYLDVENPNGTAVAVASDYRDGQAPDGSLEFSLSGDVFEQTGWEPSDFDPDDGETISKELTVEISVFIMSSGTGDDGMESNEEFAEVTDTITVTVHDAPDDDGGSGNASIEITASGSADISE